MAKFPLAHAEPDGTVEANARLMQESGKVWNQVAELVGQDRVSTDASGKPVVNLNGRKEIDAYIEMRRPWRRMAVARMREQQAKADRGRVSVRNPHGQVVKVEPELEGVVARKGFSSVRRAPVGMPGTERTIYHADGTKTVIRRGLHE